MDMMKLKSCCTYRNSINRNLVPFLVIYDKVCLKAQWPNMLPLISGFCSMMQLRVLAPASDWDPSPSQG